MMNNHGCDGIFMLWDATINNNPVFAIKSMYDPAHMKRLYCVLTIQLYVQYRSWWLYYNFPLSILPWKNQFPLFFQDTQMLPKVPVPITAFVTPVVMYGGVSSMCCRSTLVVGFSGEDIFKLHNCCSISMAYSNHCALIIALYAVIEQKSDIYHFQKTFTP